jgi:putative oxidoreductase
MNWSGTLKGEGFELHLPGIGNTLAVMIMGSGAFSLDRLITARGK